MKLTYIYSDLNPNTPFDKALIKDIESIYNSIATIISTSPKERLFNPNFGVSNLDDTVFDLINEDTAFLIFQNLLYSIETWEPRVEIDYGNSYVEADADNNKYDIKLVFNIIGLGDDFFEFSGSITK